MSEGESHREKHKPLTAAAVSIGRGAKAAINAVRPKKKHHASEQTAETSTGSNSLQESERVQVDDEKTTTEDYLKENLKDSTDSNTESNDDSTIELHPILDTLTADATLAVILAMAIAIYPTITGWDEIRLNRMPMSVTIPWALVCFAMGNAFASYQNQTHYYLTVTKSSGKKGDDEKRNKAGSILDQEMEIARELVHNESIKKHSILSTIVGSSRLRFTTVTQKVTSSLQRTTTNVSTFTSLDRKEKKLFQWQRRADPTKDAKNSMLMMNLLKNSALRRVKRNKAADSSVVSYEEEPEMIETTTEFGAFDLANTKADTLESFVIEPVLSLRGMDVFLSEETEADISNHPWFIQQGLRDIPTIVVNVLTQWGNILIYFALPRWVKDWDNIKESNDDADDVKALKRFLNGSSEYRNDRFMMIPSVVDGPLPVKVLAPPKKETLIHGRIMPVSWVKHDPRTAPDGRKLAPAMECEFDCISSRAIRSMAGIVKKHLHKLVIDLAVVVGKPPKQKEPEFQAVLGLFRFDHIDISTCPPFPSHETDESQLMAFDLDVVKASRLVQMSEAEITVLASE